GVYLYNSRRQKKADFFSGKREKTKNDLGSVQLYPPVMSLAEVEENGERMYNRRPLIASRRSPGFRPASDAARPGSTYSTRPGIAVPGPQRLHGKVALPSRGPSVRFDRVCRWENAPAERHSWEGSLTPMSRAFAVRSSGFPAHPSRTEGRSSSG